LFKELFSLRQRELAVTKCKLKFEKLVFECGFQADHLPTICMFYNEMRDFKRKLILYVMKSIKEMFFWL